MKAKAKTPHAVRQATLLALQADLTTRIISVKQELASHQNPDWEDQATEREDDEVLEARAASAQLELRQTKAALTRLEDGTYGICAKCGTEIEDARLDALPYTPFCKNCAG